MLKCLVIFDLCFSFSFINLNKWLNISIFRKLTMHNISIKQSQYWYEYDCNSVTIWETVINTRSISSAPWTITIGSFCCLFFFFFRNLYRTKRETTRLLTRFIEISSQTLNLWKFGLIGFGFYWNQVWLLSMWSRHWIGAQSGHASKCFT